MKKRIIFGLLAVFFLGLLVRTWKLTEYPVSLSMDEVSIGYNAYSILRTGKDEHGASLPLAFKSVGDYKPPVDIYLTSVSMAIFGMNEFAVRFPVALIGALSIVVLVALVRLLGLSWTASLFSGFWLAILPWHIHFSRASFEAITALFFLLAGSVIFILWVKKRRLIYSISSAALFSLSVWTYHAERVFVPLLVISLFWIFKDQINLKNGKTKKQALFFLITTLIFAIPFLRLLFFTPAIKERALSTSIIREQSLANFLHRGDYKNLVEYIFDNDSYLIFRHWLGKYLNYYDFRLWFWKGMQFTPPEYQGVGFLYVVDLPLFLFGLYALTQSKNKKLKSLALFWFLAGPLSASLTMNEQHPLRALVWIPFFGITLASGVDFISKKLKLTKPALIYIVLALFNFVYFTDIYIKQFPRYYSEYWQYGYKQIALYACENKDNHDDIFVSESFGTKSDITGLPHLYLLFYCKYDPAEYLIDPSIDNIKIKRPYWIEDQYEYKNSLFIAAPWDFPIEDVPEQAIIKKLEFVNNEPSFIFVDTGKLVF